MTVSIRASLLLSAFAMAALTAAFASPDRVASDETNAPGHVGPWTHGGEDGAEHWGDVSAESKPCTAGLQQSPIDLSSAISAEAIAPAPRWIPAHGAQVVNNGHTLQVTLKNAGSIRLDGKDYALEQFHFHHPSEHTIAGKTFPLEAHFVHTAANGDLAVIGVMFEEGEANPDLDPIWAAAPGKESEAQMIGDIDPAKFMPDTLGAYRYEGSLTTPPCSETVHWTVMAAPVTASASQIAAFASLFPWNARPVQPLNRRYVLKTSS